MEIDFKINNYISLKLKDNHTVIFVKNREFKMCIGLVFNISKTETKEFDEIKSIDEAIDVYRRINNTSTTGIRIELDPEEEFKGHCSNLQVWAENEYNTYLLHSNLAFPLLKELARVGDPIAKRRFKEEVAKRFSDGYLPVMLYITKQRFLSILTKEEAEAIFNEINFNSLIQKDVRMTLDLLCQFIKTEIRGAKECLRNLILEGAQKENTGLIKRCLTLELKCLKNFNDNKEVEVIFNEINFNSLIQKDVRITLDLLCWFIKTEIRGAKERLKSLILEGFLNKNLSLVRYIVYESKNLENFIDKRDFENIFNEIDFDTLFQKTIRTTLDLLCWLIKIEIRGAKERLKGLIIEGFKNENLSLVEICLAPMIGLGSTSYIKDFSAEEYHNLDISKFKEIITKIEIKIQQMYSWL